MQINLISAWLLLGAGLTAIPTAPSAVLFENSEVKVVRGLERAHVAGEFHQHEMSRVMVYLQSGEQRYRYQDGRPTTIFDYHAGQVLWSPPTGMHLGEVLDHDFNVVEVELKTPGTDKPIGAQLGPSVGPGFDPSLDPVKLDPRHYTLEFENSQVRVVRVKVEPHGTTPLHAHTTHRVTVLLTDQKFQAEDQNGKVTIVEHKAGDVTWGSAVEHKEQNLSDQPFEALNIDIKR